MEIKIIELGKDDGGLCWPCGNVPARYFVELKDKGFNICYACKCALQTALDKPEKA